MSAPVDLRRAIAQAVYELALADGRRDMHNVQADLLEALGLPEGVMVDLTDHTAVAAAMSTLGVDWEPAS